MAETGDHFSVFDGYNSTEMRECDCGATRTPSSGPMCTTAATFQIVSNSSKEASVIHNSHRQGSNGCRLHQAHLACLLDDRGCEYYVSEKLVETHPVGY